LTSCSSGGYYGYVGDDPAGVEAALAELGHVGDTFAILAGEVEHDTRSIQPVLAQRPYRSGAGAGVASG
jgi:hypothetical protein